VTESTFETVPKIVMGRKPVTCATCGAAVYCNVDIFAETLEVIPDEMEFHLQWHDRNDR
jgi:hypothetical protein